MSILKPTTVQSMVVPCRIGQRRQVVLPKSVFDKLGLAEGDFMEVMTRRRQVIMRPKRPVSSDDTLTPSEGRKVRHGLKQIRQGKTRPWRAIKNELDL